MQEYVFIKQYGQRRTGTNYLFSLLHRNFSNVKVLTNHLGWKHGGHKDYKILYKKTKKKLIAHVGSTAYDELENAINANRVYKAVSIKNPYAWMDSIQRYFRVSYSDEEAEKAIGGYNRVYRHWKESCFDAGNEGILVRYEDVLRDYRIILRIIQKDTVGLKRKEKHLHNVGKAVGPRSLQKDFANYYLNAEYIKKLPKSQIRIVTKHADWKLLKFYGYRKGEH